MALKVKVTAPGGFESQDGYRRVLGIQVDLVGGVVLIATGDYKDEAWRREHPQSHVNSNAYRLDAHEHPADQSAIKDDSGKVKVIDIEAVPSGPQFLGYPIGTYFPKITPETTLREISGAIAYGYAKTRAENAGAMDC